MRSFIAFKISPQVQEELQNVQTRLKRYNQKNHINWSKTTGFHITVQFLGEISSSLLEPISNILRNLSSQYQPFIFRLDKLGGFPSGFSNPSVVIASAVEETKGAARFILELKKELNKFSIAEDNKPWVPHITLGRNQNHEKIAGLDTVKLQPIVWQVNSVELMESDLRPNGPKYTILESFNFK